MAIVGTAGHVDHGKSALVEALTGTNPDRLPEERARGMTLDLGFARLRLDGGLEAGIIDVPGHERFLHNMLAGAAGMDVLLLVVSADEGVKPQTREHLDILRYLNVGSTIVVVTKIDLVAPHERDAAFARIVSELRDTPARDAPFAGVSSVTGEGLASLRTLLVHALRQVCARDADAPAYLPIDRVFSLPGRGTIVTGTLMQGRITAGERLVLQPSGKPARVRGIEIFGRAVAQAVGGTRVALNLAGMQTRDVARGDAAVSEGIVARWQLPVRFTPLPCALDVLRRRTPVRVYLGSAEIAGTLVFHDIPREACDVDAALLLHEPAVAFAGVRFVVRRPSPKMLLGGGFVTGAGLASGGGHAIELAILAVLQSRGLAVSDIAGIAFDADAREAATRETLADLAARGAVLTLRNPEAYVDAGQARALLARVVDRLEQAQIAEPWAMGVTSLALARTLGIAEALLVRVLAEFVNRGQLKRRAGYYATPSHHPVLTPYQRAFFDDLIRFDRQRPYVPANFAQVVAAVRRCTIVGAVRAFDTLLAQEEFVRVGDDLYAAAQIAGIRSRVAEHFYQCETLTPAQFRDAIGSSRKHVIPLLEWLDAAGLTVRTRDARALRAAHPKTMT